jgi:LysR family transcriptional regulator (chromosome initiation inhibitor)
MPSHVIGSSHAFVEAALMDLGWGMNPEALVKEHIASGRLIALVPDQPLDVTLCWQVSRLTEKALAPLTRAVRSAARLQLRQT